MIEITRRTRETDVRLALDVTPGAVSRVATGTRFLDHMLETLARYGDLGLVLEATGDLRHHLVEDTAIALGQAVRQAAAHPVARYGDRVVPMDDALVHASLDLGGRAYYEGGLPSSYYEHWMQAFAINAAATLHLRVLRGGDRHHVVEAAFKALGFALRQALAPAAGVFSTKGAVETRGAEGAGPAGAEGSPPDPATRVSTRPPRGDA
jgi:imidazoleglycerol-phosphate dehydratase